MPGVACDRFDGQNLRADQFFLSHCHSDHMIGLENLVDELIHRNHVKVNHRINCSKISKAFLVNKYKRLDERFVRDLAPNEPVTLSIFDKAKKSMYNVRVTAIPANHCPGSIMFLYESLSDDGSSAAPTHRILYTGDFRFENIPLTSLNALHLNLEPIQVDEMYLDTTFCTPKYPTFPDRDEALRGIWEIVSGWIRKNGMYRKQRAKHVVLFHLPAQYGSEAILREIYEKSQTKWKIHVPERKYVDYLCFDDLGDCTDDNPNLAQWIHACSKKDDASRNGRNLPCQSHEPFEVCQIRPSAMYFNEARLKATQPRGVKCVGGNYYRVCYSCHSSRDELMDFVRYFKPRKLIPSVIPQGYSLEEVLSQFAEVLEPSSIEPSPELHVYQSLGNLPSEPSQGSPKHRSEETHQIRLLQSWTSPTGRQSSRKRRKSGSPLSMDVSSPSSPIPKKYLPQLDRRPLNPESSDESGGESMNLQQARSKRKSFQRSRSSKTNYSMPVVSSGNFIEVPNQQNRRASLPHNLKIPAITITPSSPSPDPNHPDYPEFFEDRLYLETKNSMSTSTESGDNHFTIGRDIRHFTRNSENSGSIESMETAASRERSELDISELNLRLSSDELQSSSALAGHSSSLEICYEKIVERQIEVVEVSDDNNSNSLNHSAKDTDVGTVEIIDGDEPDMEDEQSTPEIDVILSKADTEVERETCLKFAKSRAGKKYLNF